MTDEESTMEISQEDIEQFADWLQYKKETSREEYHSAPCEVDPRRNDKVLGRHLAWKKAHREFTNWRDNVEEEDDE